jgi:tRNA(fMet)-specific endonuclease VapC
MQNSNGERKTYLLDTTHCLYAMFGFSYMEKIANTIPASKLVTSVITMSELIYGAFKSERITSNLGRIEVFLKNMEVYPIDESTAEVCGRLKSAISESEWYGWTEGGKLVIRY